ncbi:CLUMA_CG001711, isoform A [Clunio marinus]|uniref:CLUMA_CG001711, isoform A n=1 Tax=Clunio marinus TaxID=568069 RepID=A0A1J1HIT6_9DIPT|nr:CLUMA_CG001711, isoform A [Clunio marinus]
MTPQVLGRLLKIEKRFCDLEKHPLRPLLSNTPERSSVSVRFLKNIFIIFYEIGIFGDIELIKDPPENIKLKVIQTRTKIIDLITKYSNWISNYIPVFARKEIDFIDSTSKETVYKIRSGIEFMLTDFKNITEEFDNILEEIREFSSIEDEFDNILTDWIEFGLHYPLKGIDIPKNLPKSHWWWFKAL